MVTNNKVLVLLAVTAIVLFSSECHALTQALDFDKSPITLESAAAIVGGERWEVFCGMGVGLILGGVASVIGGGPVGVGFGWSSVLHGITFLSACF